MNYSAAHLARTARTAKWFASTRLGLFYHWGLYTGGGNTNRRPESQRPLTYPNPTALEAAAPDPIAVAENFAKNALHIKAGYITLTALHSGSGYCVLYPTKVEGFITKTKTDYIGAFIKVLTSHSIKPLLYLPADPHHHVSPDGPWLGQRAHTDAGYAEMLKQLVDELASLHGDKIGGFWIDGMGPHYRDLPAHIHQRLPEAIVINNNNTSLDIDDVDYGTTEFIAPGADPDYSRPTALRRMEPRYRISIAGRDFNEDIPTCNGWWHKSDELTSADARPYLSDHRYLLRQMISSLGQRGQWNFALGLGPQVDGTAPPAFVPSLDTVADFMSWGQESILNTRGGEDSQIIPGFFTAPWSDEGYCSVTQSLNQPSCHYILVTTAPDSDQALFHSKGAVPRKITDLRSGEQLPVTMMSGILLKNINWSDVEQLGVKVFKVEF